MQTRHYYRGTTRGWPGNPVLQENRITCVTTDPLIATLFAIECRNHGQAAVLVASKMDFPSVAGENFFAITESAVNLVVSPLEFEQRALLVVDVDSAIDVLKELGYDEIPARFANRGHLHEEVLAYSAQRRLTLKQILDFDRRIGLEET